MNEAWLPALSTASSLAMLILGFVALWLAYEALGRPKVDDPKKTLRRHRIVGWIFLAIFAPMFVLMLDRFAEFKIGGLASFHIVLALAAAVLIAVKISIVRRHTKFMPGLYALGAAFLALTVACVGLVAGDFIGETVKAGELDHGEAAETNAAALSSKLPPVERKFVSLCSQCHPLGRAIYEIHESKSQAAWETVVDRMRTKTDTISEADGKQIAEYLAQLSEH